MDAKFVLEISAVRAMIMSAALILAACLAPTPTTAPVGLYITEPWTRAVAMAEAESTPSHAASMETMSATHTLSPTMERGIEGARSAVYMTIHNPTNEPDRLIQVESDAAKAVEMHTVVEKNGMMSMQAVQGIDLPANNQVILKPGGFHIMLIGLTRALEIGDTMTVTLTFEKAGSMTVQVPVRER